MPTASFATTARTIFVAAVGLAILFHSSVAQAHFTLDYPPEWTVDSDTSGDPQKAFPCGVLSTDTFNMSGMMTTFAPGQTITVKWTEVIAHDGWFRIAVSYMNGAEFQSTTDFPEPVYATDNTPAPFGPNSLDASIENPPVPPVLMDDIAPHSAASVSTPMQYSQDIVLPTTLCNKCVLQVIQIMLNHPVNQPNNVAGAAYTYHHCAFIAIQPNGDGGTQVLADAGSPLDAGGDSTGGGPLDASMGSMGSDGSKTGTGSSGSSGGGATSSGSSGAGTSSGTGTSNAGTTSSGSGVSKGSGASVGDGAPTPGAAGGPSMGGSGSCTLSPTTRPDATTAAGLVALGFVATARRRRRRRAAT